MQLVIEEAQAKVARACEECSGPKEKYSNKPGNDFPNPHCSLTASPNMLLPRSWTGSQVFLVKILKIFGVFFQLGKIGDAEFTVYVLYP